MCQLGSQYGAPCLPQECCCCLLAVDLPFELWSTSRAVLWISFDLFLLPLHRTFALDLHQLDIWINDLERFGDVSLFVLGSVGEGFVVILDTHAYTRSMTREDLLLESFEYGQKIRTPGRLTRGLDVPGFGIEKTLLFMAIHEFDDGVVQKLLDYTICTIPTTLLIARIHENFGHCLRRCNSLFTRTGQSLPFHSPGLISGLRSFLLHTSHSSHFHTSKISLTNLNTIASCSLDISIELTSRRHIPLPKSAA